MGAWLRELIDRRDLFYSIAQREIKIKYKQSVMGFLWAIFMPLLIVAAGILVKYAYASLAGTSVSLHDVGAVSARAVPWAFFVSSIRFGSVSLVGNSNLVTKIYMPREIFPLAAVASQLVDFLVACVALAIFLPIAGLTARSEQLLLPLLLVLLVLLASAFALLLSAASLFFRDVKYLVEVVVTFAIFFTPVFYDVDMVGRWANVLMLNPVAPLLEAISAAVIGGRMPSTGWMLYSVGFTLAAFAFSLVTFKRLEPYFAESV